MLNRYAIVGALLFGLAGGCKTTAPASQQLNKPQLATPLPAAAKAKAATEAADCAAGTAPKGSGDQATPSADFFPKEVCPAGADAPGQADAGVPSRSQ